MKTDTQLQHDVAEALKWEPQVTSSQVGVFVKDGVVTLSGEVGSYAEKWHAEHAAQRVSGVDALTVDLTVKLSELGRRTDADIARSAENVLSASTAVPADSVKVMVEHGFISLTGTVDWQSQRLAAAVCLRSLVGVKGVSNQIVIKPQPSSGAVASAIEAALTGSTGANGHDIQVSIAGTEVTLQGKVESWAALETATRSAGNTPGVHNVVNKMTLT